MSIDHGGKKRAACLLGAVAMTALMMPPPAFAQKSQGTASGASRQTASGSYQNWYPASIKMPGGLQYPCALTALPRDLPGIPAADKRYINHVYAMILQCVQAKTALMAELQHPSRARSAYTSYYSKTVAAMGKIKQEKTPNGLAAFKKQVLEAITLQVNFFDKASKMAAQGKSMQTLMAIPEGRQASALLIQAFNQMTASYPSMAQATKDSIYHHLCALDLF